MENKKEWVLIEYHGDKKSQIKFCDRNELVKKTFANTDIFSVGVGYGTKEALLKGEEINKEPCKICGNIVRGGYQNANDFIHDGICFSCDHWRNIEKTLEDPNRIIVNGTCYMMREETKSYFKGHGGHEFKVQKFGSEEIIKCTNLWCQGDIPIVWRERLKDNAKFVKS
jgi:hypothetical protein